jgi:hypothetical protein
MAGSHFYDQAGYRSAAAVTPSDATVFSTTKGLYVGGTGALAVTMANGEVVTFTAVPVGFHPLQVTQVRATGTAATNIIALR